MDINQLILWLMPFVVWIVTELVRKFKPMIPGWAILTVVVPLLSGALTLISNYLATPGQTWLVQFLFGLLAVFISQLRIQLSAEKRAEDKSNDKIGQ